MNVRGLSRVAVDSYLKLVRLPLSRAISLLPGNGNGARTALDRADGALRVAIAAVLRDPVLAEDAQQRRSTPDEPAHASSSTQGQVRDMQKDAGHEGVRRRPPPKPKQALRGETRRRPQAPQPRHGEQEHAATARPSQDEIAARAYALYERGAPGNAVEHWLAAERELTSTHE